MELETELVDIVDCVDGTGCGTVTLTPATATGTPEASLTTRWGHRTRSESAAPNGIVIW